MEYADLVGRIVAAEQRAKALVQEAKEQEESLEAGLEQEIAAMRESYMNRARRRVAEVEKAEAAMAEESLQHWDQKLEQTMSAVEAAYAKHREVWIDVLVRKIVGGTP